MPLFAKSSQIGRLAKPACCQNRTHEANTVLDIRRKASAVRASIGLPASEIFVKYPGGDGSEPDVAWQCTFADVGARDADLAVRAASGN